LCLHGEIATCNLLQSLFSGYNYMGTALIWSDRVKSAMHSWVLLLLLKLFRGQSAQRSGQLLRRLISLIFAGRNRIIVIRRELPRTSSASWA
jgi:hypothetical protein